MTKKFILAAALVASVSFAANFTTTMSEVEVQGQIAMSIMRGESASDIITAAKTANLNLEIVVAALASGGVPLESIIPVAINAGMTPVTITRTLLAAGIPSVGDNEITAALEYAGIRNVPDIIQEARAPVQTEGAEATAAGPTTTTPTGGTENADQSGQPTTNTVGTPGAPSGALAGGGFTGPTGSTGGGGGSSSVSRS